MFSFYQVFAHVYPAQGNRVLVKTFIFVVEALALPAPSLISHYNFFTLRRYFTTREQAEKWAAYLHKTHAIGPVKNSIRNSGQLDFSF